MRNISVSTNPKKIKGLAYPGTPMTYARIFVGPDWLFWAMQAVYLLIGFASTIGFLFFMYIGCAFTCNPRRIFRVWRATGFLNRRRSAGMRKLVYLSPQIGLWFFMTVPTMCSMWLQWKVRGRDNQFFDWKMGAILVCLVLMAALFAIQYLCYIRPRKKLQPREAAMSV